MKNQIKKGEVYTYIFLLASAYFLFIQPLILFFLPSLPSKLNLGFNFLVVLFASIHLREKFSFVVIVALLILLVLLSLFWTSLNPGILVLGVLNYLTAFLTIAVMRNLSLTNGVVKKFFNLLLFVAVIQFPVNLILMFLLINNHKIWIVDIAMGTFGSYGTGALAIFLLLILFVLFLRKSCKKSYLYWLLICLLTFSIITCHSGGAIIILFFVIGVKIVLGFEKNAVLRGFVIIFIAIISSILILKLYQIILPDDRRDEFQNFGNVITYTLGHFAGNLHVVEVADEGNDGGNTNKMSILYRTVDYVNENGNLLTGTQTGSLFPYLKTNINSIDSGYMIDKAFPYFYIQYRNGYAVILGESGLIGLVILTAGLIFMLYRKEYLKESRQIIINRTLWISVFIIYNFYMYSYFNYQFLFLWSFLYFNLSTLTQEEANLI